MNNFQSFKVSKIVTTIKMASIKHWLFRVGPNAQDLYNCHKYNIWGVNSANTNARKFLREANQGDIIWFVKGASKGLLISYATYVQAINRVKGENMSDEELGWVEQCPWVKNKGWDVEIQFENYSDIENMGLLSQIKQSANPRRYSEKCMIILPRVYHDFNCAKQEDLLLASNIEEGDDETKDIENELGNELKTIRDACSNIFNSLNNLNEILNKM
jgi:hypothetical protein